VLLRPSLARERAQLVAMASGVAMADAVERVAGFAPALKWPNDLVVGERKLAGILAEADGGAVVVGIGVNVNWDEFPSDLAETATSCNLEAGRDVDRRELLTAFLIELRDRYARLEHVPGEYQRRLATLGRRVRVEGAGGDIVGRAVGVGDSGELLVDDDAGAVV